MKHISFLSTLLVPMPEYTQGMNFRWIDTFRGESEKSDDTVNVLVFNSEDKNEFRLLLEKNLETLHNIEPTDNVRRQIEYITQLLAELNNPMMHHDAPTEVLQALERASGKRLMRNQVIYLSGATHIRA